jgi:hypothetical protein
MSGTGPATLYAYDANGQTAKSDTDNQATITLASGGSLTVKLVPAFALSNIVKQGNTLTFNDGTQIRSNISPRSQGLLFRWGSMVGVSPIGAFSTSSPTNTIRFTPSEYTGTISTYDGIPYDQPTSTVLPNTFSASTAIGDICAYISAKGWVDGAWRLPTVAELQSLLNAGYVREGPFTQETITDYDGLGQLISGYNFGSGDHQWFLPASSHRGNAGAYFAVNVGAEAVYWSATTNSNNTTGQTLGFGSGSVSISVGNKVESTSIRCVKDDAPKASLAPSNISVETVTGSATQFTVYAPPGASWNIYTNGGSWLKIATSAAGAGAATTKSGTGTTTLYAYNSDGTASASDSDQKGVIVLTGGSATNIVTVNLTPAFARSNVVYANGHLTFNDGTSATSSISEQSQGLMFQWGSLVGISPSVAITSENISTSLYVPMTYPTAITQFANIPYSSVAGTLANSYDAVAGTGDVCAYISSMGWVDGRWRMPTSTEMNQKWHGGSTPTIVGAPWSIISPTNTTGTYLIPYGLSLGTNTGSTQYLPASGYMTSAGTFYPAGSQMDFYYSSTAPNASTGTGLYITYTGGSSFGLTTASYNKQYSTPIRCVHDFSPAPPQTVNLAPDAVDLPASAGNTVPIYVIADKEVSWTLTAYSTNDWLHVAGSSGGSGHALTYSGTGTKTVYAYMNNASEAMLMPDAYISVTSGNGSINGSSTKVYAVTPSGVFAYSNIYEDSNGRLTFATSANATTEKYQGLLFKWGSLVGVRPLSPFSASTGLKIPSEYTPTISGWEGIPYDNTTTAGILPTTFNAAAGTGDICAYISSKGWVSGSWRMPTFAEWSALIDAGTESIGTFATITTANDANGVTQIPSGWYIGSGDAERFLPVSGSYSNANLWNVGSATYYYASTLMNTGDPRGPYITNSGIDLTWGLNRLMATPIRCVKQ